MKATMHYEGGLVADTCWRYLDGMGIEWFCFALVLSGDRMGYTGSDIHDIGRDWCLFLPGDVASEGMKKD